MSEEQKTYGLVGKSISYSFSEKYFTEKFKKNKIQNCTYKNFDLNNIKDLVSILKENDLKGLNITIPYKEQVLSYLDEIEDNAKLIGAINTIKINKDKTLTGYNTDFIGFINTLRPYINSNCKKALILGTGGASKAIEYGLKKLNIESKKISRNKKKGDLTYLEIDSDLIKEYQIIINTTPLGTYPDIENYPDIPYKYLTKKHICYDLIYNPDETTFLRKSKKKGAITINGLRMLEIQAEESWKIWNN
jgi:shikimate dehydrogenase